MNISTSLILSHLDSTMTVYTSSVLRAAAPFWLKTNYSCYFCPCVSNSVLPSRVFLLPLSQPPFTTSFLCFIPVLFQFIPPSLASLPYHSLAPLTPFIFLDSVSAVLGAAATIPAWL